jgi:prenyltransferase beta subunit
MSCNHAYVNFKFQLKKDGTVITIFSSLLLRKQGYCESRIETKFIVTYLSRLLQENQGYFESKKIFNYEMSLVYGKSLG